jgi:hypothetical protein
MEKADADKCCDPNYVRCTNVGPTPLVGPTPVSFSWEKREEKTEQLTYTT